MSHITNLNHSKLIERYPVLASCEQDIIKSVNMMIDSYKAGGKLLAMGNGGSSADAEHICGELLKGFVSKRELTDDDKKVLAKVDEGLAPKLQGALPAISLGVGHSFISAFINDVDADFTFAQQIWGLGNKEDIVIGISTSGNSKNVINGFKICRAKGIPSIALTGESGGACVDHADVVIKAPASVTHHVQEYHLPIYHAICLELEGFFFN